MPSLEETLKLVERLEAATKDAKAVLSETHGAVKDFRQIKKEIDGLIASIPKKAEDAVSKEIVEAIKKDIDISVKGIHKLYAHAIDQFDLLFGPIYESMNIVRTKAGLEIVPEYEDWISNAKAEFEREQAQERSESEDNPG